MLKGTQILTGDAAVQYVTLRDVMEMFVLARGYEQVIVPTIWEAETFKAKIQGETLDQLWEFKDKGGRDVCLVPEITGLIQSVYDEHWVKELPKPVKVYYFARCFRYEKPQAGRLREFTQFGVEWLNPRLTEEAEAECKKDLEDLIEKLCPDIHEWHDSVKRGLGYYISDGFEATVPTLGAQKQIAGGGRYAQGIGWAIGVERVLLALDIHSSGDGSSDG